MIAFSTWLVIGLAAAFMAHLISHDRGIRYGLDIFLGVAAALMGGALVEMFGAAGGTGVNFYSLGVPLVCTIVMLTLFHTVIKPTVSLPAMESSSNFEWVEVTSPTAHSELKETHPNL